MSQQLASVTATVLAAPADGVAPALLLSITDSSSKGRTLGQYLVNAPEGVSRLMLEHKCRPGLHFKALFLSGCSAAEAGGLGGLLLRLKQDGNGAMQLVGPEGVLCSVLRRWYVITHYRRVMTSSCGASWVNMRCSGGLDFMQCCCPLQASWLSAQNIITGT